MRLGACFLIPTLLLGQSASRNLPWDKAPEPPWRVSDPGPEPLPLLSASPETNSPECRVSLSADGTLRILDKRGLVRLRMGLPGRPLRIWRDGGSPMALKDFPCRFPSDTPLSKGLGGVPLGSSDFRPALQGLLWILDDGVPPILTVVHPATTQVAYLPLPGGQDLELRMHPDRLEAREMTVSGGERKELLCWSVPWLGLLPQFMRLSTAPAAPPAGTALVPYPKE